MNSFQIWLTAIRPKTLFASIAPVLIGTAMAFADGGLHGPSALAALLGALLIQIETNLVNDYYDFKKGADKEGRIGPVRVMQAGLVTAKQMKMAISFVLIAIVAISIFLTLRAGRVVVVIAVTSILSAFLYTAGPKPLGYLGLGDVFVFIFFGPVAVGGTYYVQTLNTNPLVIIAGLAPGLLSVAILTVNNLRDMESDRNAGKKTLAVRFGRTFAMCEYFLSVMVASMIPMILCTMTQDYFASLLAVSIAILAFPAFRTVFTKTDGPSLNRTLAYTGFLLFIYSILFSAGWAL